MHILQYKIDYKTKLNLERLYIILFKYSSKLATVFKPFGLMLQILYVEARKLWKSRNLCNCI